jgi:diguanylate cyclase (GGDEF)-like protein
MRVNFYRALLLHALKANTFSGISVFEREREIRPGKGKTLTDLALLGLFAACAYVLAFLTEAYEWFDRWAGRHEGWQADEILMLLALLSVAVAAFAWRRWKEADTEIARREELQEELKHRATHDALTDLPNRALLMDRLEHTIERVIRERVMIAVLFIDLDDFKDVNDAFGHGAGDRLLTQAAGRLKRCVRSADTVSRIGGDEFVVVLESVEDAERVAEVVGRIMESLGAPFTLGRDEASLSASIGVAFLDGVGVLDGVAEREAEELVRDADRAMYRAKGEGGARYEISDGR